MTVGELLTAFPWIAPVEVDSPCGVDENGETDYAIAWVGVMIAKYPELPPAVAAKEIYEVAVFNTESVTGFGDRPTLVIFTK